MKLKIEVEIPNGEYCHDRDNGIFCQYMGNAHCGAGCCNLVVGYRDSIIYWKDQGKSIDKREYKYIVKHKECPNKESDAKKQEETKG